MAFSPQTFEQIIHVKTVEDSGYDSALPHAVAEVEPAGVDTVPFHIGSLHHVDEEEKTNEDSRKSRRHQLLEKEAML